MKKDNDILLIQALSSAQQGVFSKPDLQTAFGEPHPSALGRRLRRLEEIGVLRRFVRGWYVAQEFHLPTLSQRLAPNSYVSFGWVLAEELVVGPKPMRRLRAVKIGRPRRYQNLGFVIQHLSTTASLMFGYDKAEDGVQYANAEKAALDVLYYHLRGARYAFDIYSDIALEKLNRSRLQQYLGRYKNPRFVTFARQTLEING